MFTLSTAHVALAVQALYQGFILQKVEPTDVFFRDNVFPNRKAIYIINTLLGDSLLLWRAYMIWQMNWMLCGLPLLFLLGTAICGIKTIVANAVSAHSSVFDPSILNWVTATFVLNIATQISATLLIAYRIYRALDFTDRRRVRARYMGLVWLVVESGAVYTAAAVVQLVTTLLDMNAGVILEFMLAQICAIAPSVIIVRVALGFTHDTTIITDGGMSNGNKGVADSSNTVLTTFRATTDHSNTLHSNSYTGREKPF
ncbi:hypothetical protein H0H92_004027 [Tricholoma furcatifolium]|nr:hypothetical protein H0H92_004027 [Tricholoma furcatifolium]